MRFCEILLILLNLAILLRPLFAFSRRWRWADLLPLALLAMLIVHLIVEGYRWQMVPLYLLSLVLGLLAGNRLRHPAGTTRTLPPTRRTYLGVVLGLIWLVPAAALPILFPVPVLPAPDGPYAVGSRTYYLRDETRDEPFTPDPADKREIMVQVWYPAGDNRGAPAAPYIEGLSIAAPVIAARLDLPGFLLDHLNLVRTHVQQDVPVASNGAPFPVILFSHGLRGLRQQNTALFISLASHGYVVVSTDHTYGNILTIFPDNRVVFYDEALAFPPGLSVVAAGKRLVNTWSQDNRFVLDQLTVWQDTAGHPLSGRVDLGRVGLAGHSTGGGTAVETCGRDSRCQAVAVLDGWIEAVSEEVVATGLAQPAIYLKTDEWLSPENSAAGAALITHSSGAVYQVTIAGAAHFDFSDLPLFSPLSPLLGLSGSINSQRALEIVNGYVLAFFDQTLKGQPAPLLTNDSSRFPEVTFEGP